jgi:hypothetical protein
MRKDKRMTTPYPPFPQARAVVRWALARRSSGPTSSRPRPRRPTSAMVRYQRIDTHHNRSWPRVTVQLLYGAPSHSLCITRTYHLQRPITSHSSPPSHSMALAVVAIGDGFLVPGKDTGGVYLVPTSGDRAGKAVKVSTDKSGFFYHNVTWRDVDGDGAWPVLLLNK